MDNILETVIETCDKSFDTFNGETLKVRLKLVNIPVPESGTNFWGLPYGNQWCAEYFTDSGYFHKGGWIGHKNNWKTWATEVNGDLFNKREDIVKNKLFIPERASFSKIRPPNDTNQYFYLSNGEKAFNGDLIRMKISFEGTWRAQCNTVYGLVCFHISCGGRLGNWHWNFGIGAEDNSWEGDKIKNISTYHVMKYGEKLTTNEDFRIAYGNLRPAYKKEWRTIHNIKGRVNFSKLNLQPIKTQ